jgi:hypothetical protein
MAYVAENVRKFFPPACIDEMLQEFVPHIIGSNLDVSMSHLSCNHLKALCSKYSRINIT